MDQASFAIFECAVFVSDGKILDYLIVGLHTVIIIFNSFKQQDYLVLYNIQSPILILLL